MTVAGLRLIGDLAAISTFSSDVKRVPRHLWGRGCNKSHRMPNQVNTADVERPRTSTGTWCARSGALRFSSADFSTTEPPNNDEQSPSTWCNSASYTLVNGELTTPRYSKKKKKSHRTMNDFLLRLDNIRFRRRSFSICHSTSTAFVCDTVTDVVHRNVEYSEIPYLTRFRWFTFRWSTRRDSPIDNFTAVNSLYATIRVHRIYLFGDYVLNDDSLF